MDNNPGMHERMFNWSKENEEDKRLQKDLEKQDVHVHKIEEIRAIQHEGEIYYNGRDLAIAMKQFAYSSSCSISVFAFIRMFTIELITAVRGGKE
jgi:hypothetical protein